MMHFQSWAERSDIPWRAVKPHLDDTLSHKARELWPEALKTLPMDDAHKESLKTHWANLHDDFKSDN